MLGAPGNAAKNSYAAGGMKKENEKKTICQYFSPDKYQYTQRSYHKNHTEFGAKGYRQV